jgi:hypothetical protein
MQVYNINDKITVDHKMKTCITFWSLAISLHTTRFKIKKILRGFHIAFMCWVWVWEQTAIFYLYSISRFFPITEMGSVYCAVRTDILYKTNTFRL